NFNLDSAAGSYLALVDPDGTTVTDSYSSYPEQPKNISYGEGANGTDGFFAAPTPGAANGTSLAGFAAEPTFSIQRGIYSSAQSLLLTAGGPSETIYYTTDGSEPVPGSHGTLYTGSIAISSSRVIRAAAGRADYGDSGIVTHSYFINPSSGAQSLPIVSLAGDPSTTFGPAGLFGDTLLRGRVAEFPLSVELLNSDSWAPSQIDAGVRLHGSSYTRRTAGSGHKWSYKLYFRDDYEPGREWLETNIIEESDLERWRLIVLRGNSFDTNPMVRDELARRLFRDMGHRGSLGSFAYLMINGSPYRNGLYNVIERLDEDTLQEKWGSNEKWDVVTKWQNNGSAVDPPRSHSEPFKFDVRDGDHLSFAEILHYAQDNDLADPAHYAFMDERVDLVNFADYLLVTGYLAVRDWPQNNWAAGRERSTSLLGRWQFFVWDSESWTTSELPGPFKVPGDPFDDAAEQPLTVFYRGLRANPQFRRLMSDRAFLHLFHGGGLTTQNVTTRFEEMRLTLASALPSMDTWIRDSWAPQRPGYVLSSLGDLDLYTHEGPGFMVGGEAQQMGGLVDVDSSLSMVVPGSGKIYYTLDGSDPQIIVESSAPTNLIDQGSAATAFIPPNGNLGTSWTDPDFDDSSWLQGTTGIGYHTSISNVYHSLIGLDVLAMRTNNSSAYVRIPFTISNQEELDRIDSLVFEMKYDDGFVATINGTEIASANSPSSPVWNSIATVGHSNAEAVEFEEFDVPSGVSALRVGANVLTLHALNRAVSNSDLLMSPRLGYRSEGGVSPSASEYVSALPIGQSVHVKARFFDGTTWSALSESTFIPGVPASSANLVISELMYNPIGTSEGTEYIELMNISASNHLDLAGVAFTGGISAVLPPGTSLAPGERLVLVANLVEFRIAYPDAPPVDIEYSGNLRNSGETIELTDASGGVIESITYSDGPPWPELADGDGFSLTRISPHLRLDPNDPNHWRSSVGIGGSPGSSDASQFPGGDQQDLLAYAFGGSLPAISTQGDEVILSYPRNLAADDVVTTVEISSDLLHWSALDPEDNAVLEGAPEDGISAVQIILQGAATPSLSRGFTRLRVQLRP
ncbi:MAG: hypothetical protein ACI9R3_006158, partial [Verrucomicrobiales bacterium]